MGAINPDIKVIKNDELSLREITNLKPSRIVISPGHGKPSNAGVCKEVILKFKDICPILGICLGHHAICEAFGADINYAAKLMHGKKSFVHIANGSPIFKGLAPVIEAARYHSLAVRRDNLPDELLVIAEDEAGEVMGIKHKDYDVYGLQFHPESILTKDGNTIIENFLNISGGAQ